MTAKLIKGTEIREKILEEITAEVAEIKEKHGVVPGLVTILIGENPASMSYVTLKIKTAHRVGFNEVQDSQPIDISEEALLALIDKYNNELLKGTLSTKIQDKKEEDYLILFRWPSILYPSLLFHWKLFASF